MEGDKNIWVAFASKGNPQGVRETIRVILELAGKVGEERLGLIVLDKDEESDLGEFLFSRFSSRNLLYLDAMQISQLEQENLSLFQSINYDLSQDSVQRARLQTLLVFRKYQTILKNSIIWHIDDDMLFAEAILENGQVKYKVGFNFFRKIREFNKRYPYVDAAIGKCTYAPPIPLLMYFSKQIGDLLNPPEKLVIDTLSSENYHDLYANDNPSFYPPAQKDWRDAIQKMLRGIPVTRPILSKIPDTHPEPQPNFLRGGNFVIFNHDLAVALPHLAFSYKGWVARRGDMIHAKMLQALGFQIFSHEYHLVHNRNFPKMDIAKAGQEYIRDMLGAIALRYMDSPKEAFGRLDAHLEHIFHLEGKLTALEETLPIPEIGLLKATVSRIKNNIKNLDKKDLSIHLEHFKNQVDKTLLDKGNAYIPQVQSLAPSVDEQ